MDTEVSYLMCATKNNLKDEIVPRKAQSLFHRCFPSPQVAYAHSVNTRAFLPPFWASQLAAVAHAKGLLFKINREPEVKAELESGQQRICTL